MLRNAKPTIFFCSFYVNRSNNNKNEVIMDWVLTNPQTTSLFSSLGSLQGDSYVTSPNAVAILDEINYKLTYEDQTLRTFRRAIGFGQNVRIDLIPLLENTKDEKILDSVIRLLVNLTIPVECLFSVDVMYRTEVGRQTICDINKLLHMCKEAFTDSKSTKSIVGFMKHILESDLKLSPQKCDQINNCLLLLRNILHIPESNMNTFLVLTTTSNHLTHGPIISMQNIILWNLFIQSIDKILIYLMTSSQRSYWGASIVQLIALIYKDQHVSKLQRLLNIWFEASLSESSEDNESNTSPPKQGSGESSPMLTSDPTSDSSDNGSGGGSKGGSSTGNNITTEDRRQALRNETEATLQEVSRKGQEYQDSMLRVTAEGLNNLHGESLDKLNDESSEIYMGLQKNEETPLYLFQQKNQQQTVKQVRTLTSNNRTSNYNKNDADNFLSPSLAAPLSMKTSISNSSDINVSNLNNLQQQNILNVDATLSTSGFKLCQKSPHSGRLTLTKGTCGPQKRCCASTQSELSDCGYGTQVENQGSISTSSNDDETSPQHHVPPCNTKARNKPRNTLTAMDKKELRRNKLVKRSKSSLINMKSLVQHIPTDDDISNLLKEFTVDFLLKGYACLVQELHSQLIMNLITPIDTSHFFWLLTYFLKFAAQLELDLEHVNTILTYDVVSYLTYEGVTLTELLELNLKQDGNDLRPYLRRIHLVVTAIREFLQAIETYKKVTHLTEADHDCLKCLQLQISKSEDLRNLFVLLLRSYKPHLHTKQYLQDLIITNHLLLLMIDTVYKTDETNFNFNNVEHISQFATPEIMHYYGILLEDFHKNGKFVNDCILTMMHHVAGDLGQIVTLFQPNILKTFSRLCESDYELCDDWSDLIEYVINKFMSVSQNNKMVLAKSSLNELTKEKNIDIKDSWTQEELDNLQMYYVQSKKHDDIVGKILKLFCNNGNKRKTRISIIQQLLQQDIITLLEYNDLMKFEGGEYHRNSLVTVTSATTESGIELIDTKTSTKVDGDIQMLRDLIIKDKKGQHLKWLQKCLLECCCVKLILKDNMLKENQQHLQYIMEPIAYHSILKNKPVPIVQWNNDQAIIMHYQPFVLLLHKLGLQLPDDAASLFVLIPDYWSVETMYILAKKLGPLNELLIKFHMNQLDGIREMDTPIFDCQYPRASFSSTSSLEVEVNDVDELTTVSTATSPMTKLDFLTDKPVNSDIFAVPKAKQCNYFNRFTPDVTTTQPTIPNWLQLVMRSKCSNTSNKSLFNNNEEPTNSLDLEDASIKKERNVYSSDTTDILLTSNNNATTISTEIDSPTTTTTTIITTTIDKIYDIKHYPMTLLSCSSVDNIIDVQLESNYLHINQSEGNNNQIIDSTIATATATATTIPTVSTTNVIHNNIYCTWSKVNEIETTTTPILIETKTHNDIGLSKQIMATTMTSDDGTSILNFINEQPQEQQSAL